MSLLFHHGRRYDLCDSNPIQWARQSAKRRTAPDILTTNEIRELLVTLPLRERTLVLLAVTTGLRRSELFALKWKHVDFENKQIQVTRSIVNSVVGSCKTESSQKPVPAHDELLGLCLDGMNNRAINRLRVGFSQAPRIRAGVLIWPSKSCDDTLFVSPATWESQSESDGTPFGIRTRHSFGPRVQS